MKSLSRYAAASGALVVAVLIVSVPAPARVTPLAVQGVTPERATSELISSPAEGGQGMPAIARGDSVALAVWDDFRGGVFGSRIATGGGVLDPVGIRIAAGGRSPAIAWNGDVFLVVWELGFGRGEEIRAARVDETGTVLDVAPITVSAAPGNQEHPSVAVAGDDFLVTWQDSREGADTDIYAARVSDGGVVLDAAGILVAGGPRVQVHPAVASDGTSFLIVWHEYDQGAGSPPKDVLAARVDSDGVVVDASPIVISSRPSNEWFADVAWGAGGYLVVWSDDRSGAFDIYGARVDSAGEVLDADGFAVSSAPNSQHNATVASDGVSFLVAWADRRDYQTGPDKDDVWGARVDGAGVVLDPTGILVSRAARRQVDPDIAAGAGHFFVVWNDSRVDYFATDIYAARVTQSGVTKEKKGILVSKSANAQLAPSVASDGTRFLIAWEDLRSGKSSIYVARMTHGGTVLDASGILVARAGRNQHRSPQVAWNGSVFLVVWGDQNIYGARVSPTGEVLDPGGFPISTAKGVQGLPEVAAAGSGFFVVWHDRRLAKGNSEIYGSRVGASGDVLDELGVRISFVAGHDGSPAVAGAGESFIVAWQNHALNKTYAARVAGTGTLLDPEPILLAEGVAGEPAVASGGSTSLVVWQTAFGHAGDLVGVRVSDAGTVMDASPITISSVPNEQGAARTTWLGDEFFVTWRDQRSGSRTDIFGTRVSDDGDVLDPAGVEIATSVSLSDYAHGVAPGAVGTAASVYSRVVLEQPYLGVHRVFLRGISWP